MGVGSRSLPLPGCVKALARGGWQGLFSGTKCLVDNLSTSSYGSLGCQLVVVYVVVF